VVAAITRSRLDEGLPPPIVDLHPDRPDKRGSMTPSGTLVLLNPEPTFEALEGAGGRVTKHAEATRLRASSSSAARSSASRRTRWDSSDTTRCATGTPCRIP
jgi:hypothetical protein